MSLPRYAEYKDSGTEWLGEIPAHWTVKSLKTVTDPNRPITYGIVQAGSEVEDGVPYIRPTDMDVERGVANPMGLMRTTVDIAESYRRSAITTGDLVCSIGPSFGKVMVTPSSLDGANLTQGTARVAIVSGASSKFVFWALRSGASIRQWEASMGGATFRSLNLGPLSNTKIAMPDLGEQSAIAIFLDRETAKIDALIAEQEKLLALLAEKRQATISHAVTRGLNPNAPMKDSGIPWLGEVPAHWNVLSLRRIARAVETGRTPSSEPPSSDLEDGLFWYTPGDFGSGLDLGESSKRVAFIQVESGEINTFPPGSILIVSIGATLGKVGISSHVASANQQINAVVLNHSMDARFFAYSLSVKAEMMRFLSNASTIGIMNQSKTKEVQVAVPTNAEQVAIAAYLDTATTKIASLEAEAESAISLLKERRSALISAAVTGKIDVRRAT